MRRRRRYPLTRHNPWNNRKRLAGNMINATRVELKQNEQITLDGNGQYFDSQSFKLSDISDYTAFTALFDTYRIMGVSYTLVPITNAYTSAAQQPNVVLAADYNDISTPTSMEKMLNRQGAKMQSFNRPVSKYIKPAVADGVYGSIATNYGQVKNKWIATSDPNTPMYGMKIGVQGAPNQSVTYQLRIKFYLQFKQPYVR